MCLSVEGPPEFDQSETTNAAKAANGVGGTSPADNGHGSFSRDLSMYRRTLARSGARHRGRVQTQVYFKSPYDSL